MLGRVLRSLWRGSLGDYRTNDLKAGALPPRSVPSLDKVATFYAPTFWFVGDSQRFSGALDTIAKEAPDGLHVADNLVTIGRNNSMLDDAAFVQAWRGSAESDADTAAVWRRYVLACAAYHCVQLDGDFVECGANAGVGVKTVVDYLGGREFPRQFWAYDLFEHSADMINHAMPEHGPDLFARVKAKFADYPQVHIVKGSVPASLEGNSPDRIAYLHIDRQQKLAEDEWFDRRGYRVMPLPTGQGLVFKR